MGTRGLYGFYKNGETKVTYNHSDSYPEWLGKHVIEFASTTSIPEMNDIFDKIILIQEDSKPTQEQIEECAKYTNLGVSTGSVEDWYCILRNSQGDLNAYKNGLRYMIDSQEFIQASLFCEWAYIINLDDNVLEVYKGFQEAWSESRYANDKLNNGYFHCKLMIALPLDDVANNPSKALDKLCSFDR